LAFWRKRHDRRELDAPDFAEWKVLQLPAYIRPVARRIPPMLLMALGLNELYARSLAIMRAEAEAENATPGPERDKALKRASLLARAMGYAALGEVMEEMESQVGRLGGEGQAGAAETLKDRARQLYEDNPQPLGIEQAAERDRKR
jgi:hypothetical protein